MPGMLHNNILLLLYIERYVPYLLFLVQYLHTLPPWIDEKSFGLQVFDLKQGTRSERPRI